MGTEHLVCTVMPVTRFGQDGSEADDDSGLSGQASSQGTEINPGSDPMSDADAFGLPPPSALPPECPTPSVTPSPSPPSSPPPVDLRWGRRRGPLWIVAGAGALLVAAVASGFAFSNRAVTAPIATLPTRSVTTSADQPSISFTAVSVTVKGQVVVFMSR